MGLPRQVRVLFLAFSLLCTSSCSAENGRCQEVPKDETHGGRQSRSYQDGKHIYQYGVRVQADIQCTAPRGVQCDSPRDKSIKKNATRRETEHVIPENKGDEIKELLETPFLNRSRPIAWLDDYKVSSSIIVMDINEILGDRFNIVSIDFNMNESEMLLSCLKYSSHGSSVNRYSIF